MIKIKYLLITLLCIMSFNALAKDDFPGRKTYFNIPVIEKNDLHENFNQYIVVDARSKYEFDTLHIKGAVNVSLNGKGFLDKLTNIRKKDSRPFVFYCNGHTCYKSYKAVSKARIGGFKRSIAFDAGIFDWSKAYPDQAVLLGKSPINPSDLIAKSVFKKKTLTVSRFLNMLPKSANVLDIRDDDQRDAISLFPFNNEIIIPLTKEKAIKSFLNKVAKTKGMLLIYDESGKQVRWLQYRLEEAKIKKYWFLKGGAKGFYAFLEEEN